MGATSAVVSIVRARGRARGGIPKDVKAPRERVPAERRWDHCGQQRRCVCVCVCLVREGRSGVGWAHERSTQTTTAVMSVRASASQVAMTKGNTSRECEHIQNSHRERDAVRVRVWKDEEEEGVLGVPEVHPCDVAAIRRCHQKSMRASASSASFCRTPLPFFLLCRIVCFRPSMRPVMRPHLLRYAGHAVSSRHRLADTPMKAHSPSPLVYTRYRACSCGRLVRLHAECE